MKVVELKTKSGVPIEPLGDRVVIKRKESPDKVGNIWIPEIAKSKALEGTVVAIGPEVDKNLLKVGEQVVFGRYVGINITIDDEEFTVLCFKDIYGKLLYKKTDKPAEVDD